MLKFSDQQCGFMWLRWNSLMQGWHTGDLLGANTYPLVLAAVRVGGEDSEATFNPIYSTECCSHLGYLPWVWEGAWWHPCHLLAIGASQNQGERDSAPRREPLPQTIAFAKHCWDPERLNYFLTLLHVSSPSDMHVCAPCLTCTLPYR